MIMAPPTQPLYRQWFHVVSVVRLYAAFQSTFTAYRRSDQRSVVNGCRHGRSGAFLLRMQCLPRSASRGQCRQVSLHVGTIKHLSAFWIELTPSSFSRQTLQWVVFAPLLRRIQDALTALAHSAVAVARLFVEQLGGFRFAAALACFHAILYGHFELKV